VREIVCGDAIECRGTDEEEALEIVCKLQIRNTFSLQYLSPFRDLTFQCAMGMFGARLGMHPHPPPM
jgi:hypothetical protein